MHLDDSSIVWHNELNVDGPVVHLTIAGYKMEGSLQIEMASIN